MGWSIMKTKMRPWLMLPAASGMEYRFYDLVEKRQVQVSAEKRGVDEESVVVGSSHGWLALFNKRNCDLFLSNPLTRRHIKLPPIHTLLPIPAEKLTISKVIPTCDPDDGSVINCLMIYGPRKQLAFCTPLSYWRNLGQRYAYGDCAYCSKYEVFFASASASASASEEEIEAWNVQRYKKEWMVEIGNQGYKPQPPSGSCFIYKSLVVAEELYDVARYVDKIDNKTIGFAVRKYNWEEKAWRHMDGSLDGLSFFLGRNHSFATPTHDLHSHLNRDAIYFTPASDHHPHDLGIFCYATKQFSSLYYPRHHPITTTTTPPFFFTPNNTVQTFDLLS